VIPDEGYLKFTFEHQPLPEYNTDWKYGKIIKWFRSKII
jgi:hypothetical protein